MCDKQQFGVNQTVIQAPGRVVDIILAWCLIYVHSSHGNKAQLPLTGRKICFRSCTCRSGILFVIQDVKHSVWECQGPMVTVASGSIYIATVTRWPLAAAR